MSDDILIVKITGKLMYPKLFHPDTRYEDKWTTDVLLDEAGKKKAQEEGLRVKVNDKWKDEFKGYDGSFIRAERPCNQVKRETLEDGSIRELKVPRERPTVKDINARDVPSSVGIGNGTDAVVRFIVKTRNKNGKVMTPAEAQKEYGGYGMFLTGVQVLNLVPYERTTDPDTDFVKEEGSFSVDDIDTGDGDGGHEVAKTDDPFDDELPKEFTQEQTILDAG